MSRFDDLLGDTSHVFLDAFAEGQMVVYRPKGGLPRSIRAIVDRPVPQPVEHGPRGVAVKVTLTVANDPVTGIDSRTFIAGGDTVDVPLVFGGPLVNCQFAKDRPAEDAGMLTLQVV